MIEQHLPAKNDVHQQCTGMVTARIQGLELQLAVLAESAANETKSTAGDKYETARAMLHIEQDQVRRQLEDARNQLAVLQTIDAGTSHPVIGIGSLVLLDDGWYFLSTGLGKVTVSGVRIMALSMQSPLGALLKGLSAGATPEFRGRMLRISDVR